MNGQFLVIAANKALTPAQADFVLATRNVFTSLEEAEQFADARTQPKGVLFVVEAPFPIPRTLVADDWVERDPSTKVCRLAPPLVLSPTKAASVASKLPFYLRSATATVVLTAAEFEWIAEKPERLALATDAQKVVYHREVERRKRSARAKQAVATKRKKYAKWPCNRKAHV